MQNTRLDNLMDGGGSPTKILYRDQPTLIWVCSRRFHISMDWVFARICSKKDIYWYTAYGYLEGSSRINNHRNVLIPTFQIMMNNGSSRTQEWMNLKILKHGSQNMWHGLSAVQIKLHTYIVASIKSWIKLSFTSAYDTWTRRRFFCLALSLRISMVSKLRRSSLRWSGLKGNVFSSMLKYLLNLLIVFC